MELGLYDGKLCWLKKDGTPSKKNVADMTALGFFNFPLPNNLGGSCEYAKIILGDPTTDKRVVVKAVGVDGKWKGHFLLKQNEPAFRLDRNSEELLEDKTLTLENADQFGYKPPQLVRFESSEEVSAESLANEKGIAVFEESLDHLGKTIYWVTDDHRYVFDLPSGWMFVPKGDAGLTRALTKNHPHWVCLEKNQYDHVERTGIYADSDTVEEVFQQLGGEEGREKRDEAKSEAVWKRESKIQEAFEKAIRTQFPNMPEDDLYEVLETATQQGRVGKAAFLYFSGGSEQEDNIESAATLAVIAHARHKYTNYDSLFSEGHSKESARREIRPELDKKLSEWS